MHIRIQLLLMLLTTISAAQHTSVQGQVPDNDSIFAAKKIETISVEKVRETVGLSDFQPGFNDILRWQLFDWSSDGELILFGYSDYSCEDCRGMSLGIMTPDVKEVKKLDLSIKFEGIPQARFSPSNDYILIGASYEEDEIRYWDLFIYDIKDNKLTRITNTRDSDYDIFFPWLADWTPDDNIIWIEGGQDSGFVNIWLMDREGNKISKLFSGRQSIWDMDVSSDGKKIVFVQFTDNFGLGVFDTDTKEFMTILTPSEPLSGMYSPRWSPNDELILYEVNTSPVGSRAPDYGQLRIVSADGTLDEVIIDGYTDLNGFIGTPVISPDGRFILFYLGERNQNDLAKLELTQPIPEFPVSIVFVLAAGIASLLLFYRMKEGSRYA